MQILMRNSHQILDIITAAFGVESMVQGTAETVCAEAANEVEELVCEWHRLRATALSLSGNHEMDAQWVPAAAKVCPAQEPSELSY